MLTRIATRRRLEPLQPEVGDPERLLKEASRRSREARQLATGDQGLSEVTRAVQGDQGADLLGVSDREEQLATAGDQG